MGIVREWGRCRVSWGRWVECGGMWGRCRSSELGKVGRVWDVRRWRLQSEMGKVGGVWGGRGGGADRVS